MVVYEVVSLELGSVGLLGSEPRRGN